MVNIITLASLERNFTKFIKQVEKQQKTFFVEVSSEPVHWVILRPVYDYERAAVGRLVQTKKGRNAKPRTSTNRRRAKR